jgi:hypothetical protein
MRDVGNKCWVTICVSMLWLLNAVAPARAQQDDRTLRVFVFAGQSNMVGADSRKQDIRLYPPFAGLDEAQKDVRFSYCIGREDKTRSEGWVELQPIEDMVGPELSFARRVTQHIKAPIAIIKSASGGTSLGGDWDPDEPTGFKLYPLTLEFVRSALADLERRKVPYRLEGFLWHQGENDMFDEKFRADYAKNLANFIACWRRDLNAPQLRFYVGELCTKTIWGMDHRPEKYAISVAQRAVCEEDPLADYVPTSNIAVEIGGEAGLHYHYGTLGQLEHGVNYADAYLRNIGKAPSTARPLARWPYAKDARVKLFVLAGHRNMEGERAFVQELKARKNTAALARDNPSIAFKYELGGGLKVSDGWEPLGPAGPYDTFGPELSFGAALARTSKEAIAIAKFTHSGSQILDWTPQGSEAPSRNLYPSFLAFVRSSMQELRDKGQTVELAGVFYHLGENDMAFGPYRSSSIERLASLIAQSRVDLGMPELKWFVSQQAPANDESVNGIDVTAQLAALVAADPHSRHIKAFELGDALDKLVIRTPGVVALGELLADSYSKRR